eukprot:TRINITY_DN25554_c0_g1_i1.p1 TRINITY_DN25554_c0_g1~~TRINITY_DN25554_c0_g1_i1.p1  ORF type:complete len:393 (+),score=56.36 TRINITY_DN25554_c0_g1_i1:85-1263(+)
MQGGFGATGAQQSKDCAFEAGHVAGAPLRISWFLVFFFLYQLAEAMKGAGIPLWVRVAQVTGNEALLLLTVLCHEMGHGTMARRRGGEIAEVLLWPFGGICFTTRPSGRGPREKLVDDLWIVGAGPATHFPMAAAWMVVLSQFIGSYANHMVVDPVWRHLIPFSGVMGHCVDPIAKGCFHTWTGFLCYNFLVQAVQLNVMLFMFNVFFPMYPMDGAKLITCSLQLFCNCRAVFAAKVLVYTSVPLAIFFIAYSWKGMHGGGIQPGIAMYMGFMCLMESYKIYQLIQQERLSSHPLFELADFSPQSIQPPQRREEEAPQVAFSQLQPFDGEGRMLGSLSASNADDAEAAPPRDNRSAWLHRFEISAAERGKTVRTLEEERLERSRLERQGRSA